MLGRENHFSLGKEVPLEAPFQYPVLVHFMILRFLLVQRTALFGPIIGSFERPFFGYRYVSSRAGVWSHLVHIKLILSNIVWTFQELGQTTAYYLIGWSPFKMQPIGSVNCKF